MEQQKLLVCLISSFNENKNNINFTIGNKNNVLIYRYSKNMCKTCIYEELEILNDFQKKYGNEYLLILPHYELERNDSIFLKNELSKFNYFSIDTVLLKIPVDSTLAPRRYFAFINSQFELDMVYFPEGSNNDEISTYLSEISKLLR